MQQHEEKSFLQGLKPIESTQFTSALKHRPPKEKDFFPGPVEPVSLFALRYAP